MRVVREKCFECFRVATKCGLSSHDFIKNDLELKKINEREKKAIQDLSKILKPAEVSSKMFQQDSIMPIIEDDSDED